MAGTTGVYPCYENQFEIGADKESTNPIADMETYGISFDNGVEEWSPYDTEGWKRRLMTGKGVTVSVSGKRHVGDTGNDFVNGMALKNGREAEAYFKWTFPDGTIIGFPDAVINVKNNGGGEATNVAPLEFDAMSNGKPEIVTSA